jgi:hypothetical protein
MTEPTPASTIVPPPIVEAVLVDRPAGTVVMRRARSLRIAERAERRRALFSAFFRHQECTRREKMRRGYAMLDAVRDPDERAMLRGLLCTLQSVHDSCSRTDDPTP